MNGFWLVPPGVPLVPPVYIPPGMIPKPEEKPTPPEEGVKLKPKAEITKVEYDMEYDARENRYRLIFNVTVGNMGGDGLIGVAVWQFTEPVTKSMTMYQTETFTVEIPLSELPETVFTKGEQLLVQAGHFEDSTFITDDTKVVNVKLEWPRIPVTPPVTPPTGAKPNIRIVGVSYPYTVEPNREFEVKVDIMNTGESGKAYVKVTPNGRPVVVDIHGNESRQISVPLVAPSTPGRYTYRIEAGYIG